MKFLKLIKDKLQTRLGLHRLSLKNRLWMLQILFVFAFLFGIYSVLIVTGVIPAFNDASYKSLKGQLDDTAKDLSHKYSVISSNTVDLAEKVNKSIEKSLSAEGLTFSDLKNRPQLLEVILEKEVEKSVFTMQKTGTSGVFVFLDATVNPSLNHAIDSKSGFYIIDMDPNVMPYSSDSLYLLYGSPTIARENKMYLHTEWELENNTGIQREKSTTDFFNIPYTAAIKYREAALQDLGYWSPFFKSAKNYEEIMTFSVPLVDKSGMPYGVCGLEISRPFLDKIMPPPTSPAFDRMALVFSTSDGDGISMKNSKVIAHNPGWLMRYEGDYLSSESVPDLKNNFKQYYFDDSNQNGIIGLDTRVSLYPSKSVFKDKKWTLAALVPRKDIKRTTQIYLIFATFFILLALGIITSYFTSRRYVEPIVTTFSNIKERGATSSKTNIPEIDDFIEFLKQYPFDTRETTQCGTECVQLSYTPVTVQSSLELDNMQFDVFAKRLETLSKAERTVFDLYIKGYTAKEICQMLYISINTVKSHNKKIYTKMNVNSRAELLAYCYKLMRDDTAV